MQSFADEVKLSKLDEPNPIEENLGLNEMETDIKTELVEERRVKHETNRNKLKLRSSREHKQLFECSYCSESFTSSKM